MKSNSFTVTKGSHDNQTYASIMFDPWGEPLNNKIKFVETATDGEVYDSGTLFQAQVDGTYSVAGKQNTAEFFKDYNDMIENTLWIYNNEPFRALPTDKVLMTGGGMAWLWQAFSDECKSVTVCDISKAQFKFISSLLEQWDGVSYGKFVYDFIIKNRILHWHLNLKEQQGKVMDRLLMIKDGDGFIKMIDDNFIFLFKKYCLGKNFVKQYNLVKEKVVIKQADIFDEMKNFNIWQINLSNATNFKYNFCNNNINKLHNLISPATKAFVKKNNSNTIKKSISSFDVPPCVALELKVPVQDIEAEIHNVQKYLVPHREDSGLGWSSFCIHGQSYNRTREESFYKDVLPYVWTKEAQECMPRTIEWLKSLGLKSLKRVRVMCLEPLGFINLHRDQTVSQLGPVNIAITHPPGCEFYLENHGVLFFSPGSAYMMNLSNHHCVINNTLERRYHIIIHGDTKTLLLNSI